MKITNDNLNVYNDNDDSLKQMLKKSMIVSLAFLILIISFFLVNLIKKDQSISISERRKLANFPKATVNNIFDGTFFKKFDEYVTDQFVEREEFRKIKVNTELNILGKKNYNNLYEYDGYIIEMINPLNEKSVKNTVNKINQIKEMYLKPENNVYFTIVPDKNYFVDNGNLKLDYNKLTEIMKDNLNFAKYIDIKSDLELSDYYKTDSHWKQENLKKIAEKITKEMDAENTVNYNEVEIADFQGTYAGRLPVNNQNDKIKILTNNILENAKVFNYDINKEEKIYNMNKINSLDKYDIYLSGGVSLLEITNQEASTEKELIVFRDSYGSSIVPLLVPSYKKITMVDTRYISPKLLKNYIEFSDQDVLFIYSTLLINSSGTLK